MNTMNLAKGLFRPDVADLWALWEDIPPFVEIHFSRSNGSIHPSVVIDAPDCPKMTINVPAIVTGEA